MRKLALLAVVAAAFVGCQKKAEEAPAVDTTAVAPATDTAAVVDSAKTDSAVVDSAKTDSAK